MPYTVLSVSVRVSPVYICAKCKERQVGDQHRLEFVDLEQANDSIAFGAPSAAFAPDGWESLAGGLHCPDCIASA